MRRMWMLALGAAMAMPLSAAATWTQASSPHFEIFTTAGGRRATDTLEAFERIRAFFASHLNLTPTPGRPVRLILFSNEREFRPYRINDAVVAYYRPGPDRDYIVMQSTAPAAHLVMVHEYVHLLLAQAGGRYPVWLNEGLAEYFATMPASGSVVDVGRAPRNRLRGLASGRMFELERLFGVTHDSPEYRTSEAGSMFYAQSWALTHLLLADDRYRPGWDRFLAMVRRGTPSAQALTTVYGRSSGEVFADLEAYVDDRRFPVRRVRFEEPPRLTAETREVSTFEAGLVTANLLAAAREDAVRARAAFEALADERPDDLPLTESRAAFEWRAAGPPAARQWLERAVALGTTDVRLHRDHAALVAREDPARAERLLEVALALDPTDVRSRTQLAALLLSRSPDDALTVLEPVTRASAVEAFDVLRVRAEAHLALGDITNAQVVARDLVQVALTRQQRGLAARLLARVDAYLEVPAAP